MAENGAFPDERVFEQWNGGYLEFAAESRQAGMSPTSVVPAANQSGVNEWQVSGSGGVRLNG
jgi:hypothetical protein